MAFKKGNKEGKGRGKGTQNKHTIAFKQLLTTTYLALEKKNGHGLQKWAEKNPSDFYKICARLIPSEIELGVPEDKTFTLKIE